MWPKRYKDYREDASLIKQKVESGKGIIGCEMHENNGWGETIHFKKRKQNVLARFFELFSKKKGEK